MLKKKKGMALITVIIVLLVMSILGTTLLSISLSETKFSINNERKMQAYYIARSGADAVATWIEDHGNEASAIIPNSGEYISDEVGFGEGVFSVKITRDTTDLREIKIESNSRLNNGGAIGKAILTMHESGGFTGDEIYTQALFGKTINIYGNAKIIGDVETVSNMEISGINNVDGTVIEGSNKSFPEPIFPSLPIRDFYKSGITNDGEYIIPSNADLIFNTTKNKILKVVLDNLDIKDLTINGEGSVFLFLRGNVKIAGNINVNATSNPNSLFIFGKEGNTIELTGTSQMNGFIYAPNLNFIMNGNSEINGAIIAGAITVGGSTVTTYEAPKISVANIVVTYFETSYNRQSWSSN